MAQVTLIGFGEAGQAFVGDDPAPARFGVFDAKTLDATLAPNKLADYRRAGVTAHPDAASALRGADVIISVVTADQALAAARTAAASLAPGALWLDMNSVAPDTTRMAARAIEDAGGRYVDVAVMAPVNPARRGVPLLLAAPHAEAAADALHAIGFRNVSVVGAKVGEASAIKMIRSVMVKGIEALAAECALAAEAAGVRDAVIASLDASWAGADWERRFDYNLDRMMVHGPRRAAEMEEAAATLDALGIDPVMTRGTIARQRAIGALHIAPPRGLAAKLGTLIPFVTRLERAA
jgi:3-hydroxyisobutyrate dehydrogenase-like beta-hydroxyacid dehydrogenase